MTQILCFFLVAVVCMKTEVNGKNIRKRQTGKCSSVVKHVGHFWMYELIEEHSDGSISPKKIQMVQCENPFLSCSKTSVCRTKFAYQREKVRHMWQVPYYVFYLNFPVATGCECRLLMNSV